MSKCNRCGNCCYLMDMEHMVKTNIACPYLIKLSDGTTKCKVYFRSRLGRNIGMGNKCYKREDVKFNYAGCPYNIEGQPFLESLG